MSEKSHTATVGVLTAEVRVLMVGSRQVTLSVYRQLDSSPSGNVKPFGRVSDKQDVSKHDHGSRVFVVGCDIETGVLVRAEHRLGTEPKRKQDMFNRREIIKDRRDYLINDQRKAVEPFSVERRIENRRQGGARRILHGKGAWLWTEPVADFEARVVRWREWKKQHNKWKDLPLIVLAGLR